MIFGYLGRLIFGGGGAAQELPTTTAGQIILTGDGVIEMAETQNIVDVSINNVVKVAENCNIVDTPLNNVIDINTRNIIIVEG